MNSRAVSWLGAAVVGACVFSVVGASPAYAEDENASVAKPAAQTAAISPIRTAAIKARFYEPEIGYPHDTVTVNRGSARIFGGLGLVALGLAGIGAGAFGIFSDTHVAALGGEGHPTNWAPLHIVAIDLGVGSLVGGIILAASGGNHTFQRDKLHGQRLAARKPTWWKGEF